MGKIASLLRFVLSEFGPLIAFWILIATLGVKAAIAGSLVAILLDAAWRRWRHLRFTRLYLLTSSLTLVFGAIDLMSQQPFMLQYESVITNIATGAVFVIGALGEKPLIQEAAEQQQGETFPGGPEVRRFFQLFTLFWAAYFFVKAGFYLWTAMTMPLTEAMALRSLVGGASLGLMILFSSTQGRRMFFLCRRLGLLPPSEANAPPEVEAPMRGLATQGEAR
jgi:intracellular septation protein A